MNCKNTYNLPLSRVRVRTHLQEFYHFCCHKCHSSFEKHYSSAYCLSLAQILTDNKIYNSRRQGKSIKKVLCCIVDAPFLTSHFSPECDTCDSKKTTSLLECAYVRVRERCNHFSPVALSLFTLSSSPLLVLTLVYTQRAVHRLILQHPHNASHSLQRKKCSFLRFFHSLRPYRPIYI